MTKTNTLTTTTGIVVTTGITAGKRVDTSAAFFLSID
jgi:hypothetical protein